MTGDTLQLLLFQTLSSISAEKNSTIIFPLPMEVLSAFGGGSDGLRQRAAGGGGVSGVVAGLAGGAVGGGERKEKEPWKN